MPAVTTSKEPASSAAKIAGGLMLVPRPDKCAVAALNCKAIQGGTRVNLDLMHGGERPHRGDTGDSGIPSKVAQKAKRASLLPFSSSDKLSMLN